jgi:hypothetical protein
MRRWLVGSATVVLAFLLMALFVYAIRHEKTTSLLSPDNRLLAVLLDRPHSPSIDRNFEVHIEEVGGPSRKVFVSPDESPSGIGSERFLWSKDSKRVLLVGKRFWVREGVQLETGEFLYLLYDVPMHKVWCNSDHEGPPFGADELAGYDFGESFTSKPAGKSNIDP